METEIETQQKVQDCHQIVGYEYNKVFEFSDDKIKYDNKNFNEFYNYEEAFEDEQQIDKDNRNMFADQSVQKLSPEEIEQMKKDESISKKKEKYCFYFTVLKTTPLNVIETLFKENPKLVNLLIVGDFDVLEIITKMNDLLIPNATVIAYSNYLENLIQPSEYMLKLKNYINVRVFDIFMRQYQVLKNRTHPFINMSGFSGYILSAYKVF
ncbi:tRNA methyltransferase, putative [Ichthyophthirius multifiliis]|uniref:tRNA (adenine(58)-N(1))-methyltransferase non-catalytic subunit TRM6 n=1 Tax=Ichthyophthirius multifiliis TaxID=5932 RepID=G0R5E6_ICHMU|nr:tRNA methyltransferase, putative [Ichthyophthirius multifiliis]EGR27304.1 tRNA methyltransferase, putative [Ichthyophthirius multifiliis]|eukprot:XP_004024188.1 tRNA methyltransferase, putative [Ichthyophthirius multifiliis]